MLGLWALPLGAIADTCGNYAAPEVLASASGASIDEASGLAAADGRPGVFYTHGDKGEAAVIVAMDTNGNVVDEHLVTNATQEDWEDLAAAPCPDEGRCLYIGDIGDNNQDRASITVYVIREPEAGDARVRSIARYTAVYPDGPADAEALLIHPCTGRLSVITKESDGLATVFSFPALDELTSDVSTLTQVAKIELLGPTAESREITAAAWDADGDRLAVRTSDRVYVWATDPKAPNAHWLDDPLEIVGAGEAQGEGLAFGPDGALYGVGEGSPIPLTRYECIDPAPGEPICEFPQTGRTCGCSQNGGAHLPWALLLPGWVFTRRRTGFIQTPR